MVIKQLFAAAVVILFFSVSVFAEPLLVIDLASYSAWTLVIDGNSSSQRAIKVPGAGWNSDKQEPRIDRLEGVDQYVEYTRSITVPEENPAQVTKIEFGAVNYGAEIYLDNELITTHHGPMMPFEADITDNVRPGNSYTLKVKAYHRRHYNGTVPVGFDYQYPHDRNSYNAKFSYGITRYVKLCVYPEVYIKDVFVRPSVTNKHLEYDVWIHNHSGSSKGLTLKGNLSGWNNVSRAYPDIPDKGVNVSANTVKKVTVGPIGWVLGSESYWWPNIPFDEDYLAVLHNLKLSLEEGAAGRDRWRQRFGFVEHAEGPYYYTVNGVRVNNISDGTPESAMSEWDCYTSSPAFNTLAGCKESWKRYMRLGMNMNRITQSTPTELMMDAADEVGFLLMPETAIRGYEDQQWHDEHLPNSCKELAWVCRNHPSVARYSLANEWGARPELIDAIIPEDGTRPLVFEVHDDGYGRVDGKLGHAYKYEHYQDYPKPATALTGLGEYAWGTDKLEESVTWGKDMRMNDICYFAPWDWINYWPNFLEGMSHAKHCWILNNHADRGDGVDGWGSGLMDWVARSYHPYVIMDVGIEKANPGYASGWPVFVPSYGKGSIIRREIEVFNNGLSGNCVKVEWQARWDSPNGELVNSGSTGTFTLEPGFHARKTISFAAPESSTEGRKLYLIMKNVVEDQVKYTEDRIYAEVTVGGGGG